MSEEQNQPSAFYGDDGHSGGAFAPPEGAGEANGQDAGEASAGPSRRRRRRRKSKGGPGGQAQPAGESAAAEQAADVIAIPTPQLVQAAPTQAVSAQNGQQINAGKRKKRKRRTGGGTEGAAQVQPQTSAAPHAGGEHRQRQSRPNGGWKRREEGPDGNREGARGSFGGGGAHYGDNFGNGNAGRRRGRFGGGGGGAAFVGPMDHSYRLANGNVADGSSSAQARMVNGNLRRYDDADIEPIAVIREDAAPRVICFIEDLFVVTKMQETARKMGVKVRFSKADKETLAAITDAPEAERPSLIVFDLNNAAAKPLTTIPKLKAKLKRGTSIIGFLQHIQGDLKLKAIEAGCDSVMPKAAFSQNVPNLLRRHGVEEEELAEA